MSTDIYTYDTISTDIYISTHIYRYLRIYATRYGDSSKSYTVALVCPDRAALDRLGARLGKLGGDLLRDKASVTQCAQSEHRGK